MIGTLLIFFVLIYLTCKIARYLGIKILTKKLNAHFPSNFTFEPGEQYFSINKLTGVGEFEEVNIEGLTLEFNFSAFFFKSTRPIIQLKAKKAHINAIKFREFQKKQIRNHNPFSFEKWLAQRMGILFFTTILKRISININDISLSWHEYNIKIQHIILFYKRLPQSVQLLFSVGDILFRGKDPIIKIPSTFLSANVTIDTLKYIISTAFDQLFLSFQRLQIHYSKNSLTISLSQISSGVSSDKESSSSLVIKPLCFLFPVVESFTNELDIQLNSFYFHAGKMQAGPLKIQRNGKIILEMHDVLTFDLGTFIIPTLNVNLTFSFFVDLMRILQLFPELAQTSPEKKISLPYWIRITGIEFHMEFSDNIIFEASAYDIRIHKNILKARQINLLSTFKPQTTKTSTFMKLNEVQTYELANVKKFNLVLETTKQIKIKGKKLDIVINPDISFPEYISCIGILASYLVKLFKGPNFVQPDDIPPTPFKVVIQAQIVRVIMKRKPLSEKITRENIAKFEALETLQKIQQRALQIIGAKTPQYFNEKEFQNESNKISFKLYRQYLSQIPSNSNDDLLTIIFKDVDFIFDGRNISQDDWKKLAKTDEKIEKVDCGNVSLLVGSGEIHSDKFDKLFSYESFEATGLFGLFSFTPKSAHDVYYIDYKCVEENLVFHVPDSSIKSVIAMDFKYSLSSMNFRISAYIFELIDDFSMITSEWERCTLNYQKPNLFNKIRYLMKTNYSLLIKKISIEINAPEKPFVPKTILEISFDTFSLVYNNLQFDCHVTNVFFDVFIKSRPRRFIKLPEFEFHIHLDAWNNKNESVLKLPLFIPIDSFRINDPTYNPYERYNTVLLTPYGIAPPEVKNMKQKLSRNNTNELSESDNLMSTISDQSSEKSKQSRLLEIDDVDSIEYGDIKLKHTNSRSDPMIIDLDYLQSLLDALFQNPAYIKNTQFTLSKDNYPSFSYARLKFTLPSISLYFNENSVNISISANELSTDIIAGALRFKASQMGITISHNKIPCVLANLSYFAFQLDKDVIHVDIGDLDSDFSAEMIPYLSKLKFRMPDMKDKKSLEINPNISEVEIDKLFPCLSMEINAQSVKLKLLNLVHSSSFPPRIELSQTKIDYFKPLCTDSDDELVCLSFSSIKLFTDDLKSPFFSSTQFNMRGLYSNTANIIFARSEDSTDLALSQNSINTIIPAFIKLIPIFRNFSEEESEKPANSSMVLKLDLSFSDKIIFHILGTNKDTLADVQCKGLMFNRSIEKGGNEKITFGIHDIEGTDINEVDKFKTFISCLNQKEDLLKFILVKQKTMMKCPVFRQIDIFIKPFFLNISVDFIQNLISQFPSASDLQLLILSDEDQDGEQFIENEQNDFAKSVPAGFYRRVSLSEFQTKICYKHQSGLVKQIMDKEFIFEGCNIDDMFGTKEEIKEILKSTLRYSLIKAVFGMVMGKKKNK